MKDRSKITGFDESIVSIKEMKLIGEMYMQDAPVDAALDVALTTPKMIANPSGTTTYNMSKLFLESSYKTKNGTDIKQDFKAYMNEAFQKVSNFMEDFSSGEYKDNFILK